MTRALIAVALTAVAVGAAACTSSGGGTVTPPVSSAAPVTSASVSAPSTAPASTVAPSSLPVSTSASATPTPSKTASKSPTTSPPPTGPPACTQAQLTLAAVRGGAFQGREIAGVLFTNSSAATCTLRGYPAAQLLRKGTNLGQAAIDNPGTVRTIVLKAGATAQVQLTAVTTCQSPISDHVRIRVPQSTASTDVPMELRGCRLSVDPIEAG